MICSSCSENTLILPHITPAKFVRVCPPCFQTYGSLFSNQLSIPGNFFFFFFLKLTKKNDIDQLINNIGSAKGLSSLCDSDSDSDMEDFDEFFSAEDEIKFEKHHRTPRIHGIKNKNE